MLRAPEARRLGAAERRRRKRRRAAAEAGAERAAQAWGHGQCLEHRQISLLRRAIQITKLPLRSPGWEIPGGRALAELEGGAPRHLGRAPRARGP